MERLDIGMTTYTASAANTTPPCVSGVIEKGAEAHKHATSLLARLSDIEHHLQGPRPPEGCGHAAANERPAPQGAVAALHSQQDTLIELLRTALLTIAKIEDSLR